jgi:predicted transcriptional regulator YdeE
VEQVILNENILNMKTSTAPLIKPEIIYKDDFLMAGMKYIGKNENFEVPKLWNELMDKTQYITNRVNENICYGLESYNEDYCKDGIFEYTAGYEVYSGNDLPKGMTLKKINRSRYAVFPIPAVVENVPKCIGEIYSLHLPSSGLKAIGDYDFEYYDNTFEANNENSLISFYIPIE